MILESEQDEDLRLRLIQKGDTFTIQEHFFETEETEDLAVFKCGTGPENVVRTYKEAVAAYKSLCGDTFRRAHLYPTEEETEQVKALTHGQFVERAQKVIDYYVEQRNALFKKRGEVDRNDLELDEEAWEHDKDIFVVNETKNGKPRRSFHLHSRWLVKRRWKEDVKLTLARSRAAGYRDF